VDYWKKRAELGHLSFWRHEWNRHQERCIDGACSCELQQQPVFALLESRTGELNGAICALTWSQEAVKKLTNVHVQLLLRMF
jgi:hypothetical protein